MFPGHILVWKAGLPELLPFSRGSGGPAPTPCGSSPRDLVIDLTLPVPACAPPSPPLLGLELMPLAGWRRYGIRWLPRRRRR